ncbi:LTA synthase family protein [Olsenella sp. An290]|uniref:LTA synthase family protein n=1 Tax=Olsenella sp. An290 TaxID=1965625 RepID=UPI000B3A2905|nr:LTA synthase family protein [Olsenella sp. An290]OUO35561.1 hypothetical protein B5F84_02320 [Olsenella sp. An290]
MTSTLALPLSAIALILLAGAAHVARELAHGRRPRAGTIAWLAVPVAVLAALGVACGAGLYTGGALELVPPCATALLAAASALLRQRALDALERLGEKNPTAARVARAAVALVAIAGSAVLGFLAVELPYNPTALSIAPGFALIQGLLIAGALTLLYFLFQRHGAGVALGVGACSLIGLAQFFVASFKASAILPNDLFVLGTAAAVSGGYVYSFGATVAQGLACLLAAVALCAPVAPARRASGRAVVRGALVNLACALATLVALWAGVTVPSYFDDLGVGMEYWYTLDYYRKQGFITTFVAVAQDLPIDVPEGYDPATAAETEAAYAATYDETLGAAQGRAAAEAQFAETRPSVVCIMNETFSDLSELAGERWGYTGPSRYRSLSDTLLGGSLDVSVLGGGTCNTEFEFLTGIPLAYVGDGKYPYSLYDLAEAPSLARQFSELGYGTTALHPNFPTNWNRNRVYEALGFDRFLSFDAFDGDPWYHSGVSDEATYDKVLEVLSESDEPQFVFDVTMQNHSSYDQNNLGDVPQYHVDGLSDYDNAHLSEYLACIEESDRALDEFLGRLRELDRPVVVVFFGDHQPALSSILNDALFPDEDPASHSARTYQTTYFVWANYDVAGSDQTGASETTSPAFLAAMAKEAIGAPLTDFQKAQLVARGEMPALSLLGALDAQGAWVGLDDEEALPQAFRDLACMSYLEFAEKLE